MASSYVKRERISTTTGLLMKGGAWFVYFINFLVNITLDWFGIGEGIDFVMMIISVILFSLWFLWNGVYVVNPKMLKVAALQMLLSIIPIVDVLPLAPTENGLLEPSITGFVSKVIKESREEDAAYNAAMEAKNTPDLPSISAYRQLNSR